MRRLLRCGCLRSVSVFRQLFRCQLQAENDFVPSRQSVLRQRDMLLHVFDRQTCAALPVQCDRERKHLFCQKAFIRTENGDKIRKIQP